MDAILANMFQDPVSSWPTWLIIIAFILILKSTGTLERMAKFLNSVLVFVKEKESLEAEQERWAAEMEAEQERWAAEREAELEEIHANAAVQAQAAKQLADQRAQQQLYVMLERSLTFLQGDFTRKITELTESHILLYQEVAGMKVVAAQAKESLVISHARLDGITALVPQIADNFNALQPHLIQLSQSSDEMQTTVKELEAAIRLLVERIKNG